MNLHIDFKTDETCQTVFKPFILEQIKALKAYDDLRPKTTRYIFHEHAERVAKDVESTALFLGADAKTAHALYWATLPHDIGKMTLPHEIWDLEDKPSEEMKNKRRAHTTLGAEMARRKLGPINHPFMHLMMDIMQNHHEQMDGKGYLGLQAPDLSWPVRLASIVEAFDGWRVERPHFGDRDISVEGVLKRMETEKSHQFDPVLFKAFAEMKRNPSQAP